MQLFIPELGTCLKLTADWTFKLHYEHRNSALLNLIKQPIKYTYMTGVPGPWDYTIPAGTVLRVSRIYIRKGLSDFSSLTFSVVLPNGKKKKGQLSGRFFAKLSDVNNIQCDVI